MDCVKFATLAAALTLLVTINATASTFGKVFVESRALSPLPDGPYPYPQPYPFPWPCPEPRPPFLCPLCPSCPKCEAIDFRS